MIPRAPVDKVYKVMKYENLSKLLSLVLERGFFRQGYEEEDLTKHTPASLDWAKQVILQKKLIDALDGKDLFGHLYHQIFNDMRALGADDDILRRLGIILNGMIIALNNSSAIWLEYIGEDNNLMGNNVEYLRGDAAKRKSMDNIKAHGPSKILNDNSLEGIYNVVYDDWGRTIGPGILNLFAMIHALTYAKMYELGDKATSDIIERYVRLYLNMRVFHLFAVFIINLGIIPQDKGCNITDYTTFLSGILSTEELKDQITRLVGQKSVAELCDEISMKLRPKLEYLPGHDVPIIKAMGIFSTSLLGSILKVEDTGIANIHELAKGKNIDGGLIVPGSPRSSTGMLFNIGVVVSLALIVLVALIFLLRWRSKAGEGKI